MNLKNQVCTHKQAERLKELGVDQKSLFFHCRHGERWDYVCSINDVQQWDEKISVFTVAELGIILPENVLKDKSEYRRRQWYNEGDDSVLKELNGFVGCYESAYSDHNNKHDRLPGYVRGYPTEAQHRAALLIYLLENKLVKAADVNTALNES